MIFLLKIKSHQIRKISKVVNMPPGGLAHGMHLQMKIAYDPQNRGRSGIRNKGDVTFVRNDFDQNHYHSDQRYENHMSNQNYEHNVDHFPFPHDYPPHHYGSWNEYNHPVNNQPTHLHQNRQIYTKDFGRLNTPRNISTNRNEAPENPEDNDIRLLLESHAKITALVYRKNLK